MNENNSTKHQSDTEWNACPQGDLEHFVSVMKKRKQISHWITGAEIVTACLAVGLIGFFGMNQLSTPSNPSPAEIAENYCPGGLYCSEVLSHAKDFVAHQLDQELSQKIERHLVDCPHCQKKVDQLKANRHNGAADQKAALQKQAKWEAFLLALNQ